ncbi:putative flavin carrier protein 2 precursor [Podospora fimiseda]|uniref:Flavin carrier protein 2 n=1 Tax=Podospora fimiseda TaxID=252190 RepID=A0AAN7C002_9PEZI|nr:putative flavin carrier protein 2 precursor [Podospora fimiseda]
MRPWGGLFAPLLLSLLAFATLAHARKVEYSSGTDKHGVTRQLAADRYPALYTGDYRDCLGGKSLFNISKYDAAYYADNMTIVFHLEGSSNIENESLMMQISVDAYGTNRFDMIFSPCNLNIASLCPLTDSVPIRAWAEIRVGPQQIGGIPDIAFAIPDFEGATKLQIFANSSQTEIGCFQAVMKNGVTVSHPYVIVPFMGFFTVVAIIASFFTAIYGVSIPHMRMHHGHSLSVLVVFETFQEIFLSGALQVDWPSILVAWRTNFAWAAGFVWVHPFTEGLASFTGITGNSSQVGNAGSILNKIGSGDVVKKIYGRPLIKEVSGAIMKRSSDFNPNDPWAYDWNGNPVEPGMPLPGTWPGFPGTLSGIHVPVADACLIGLIWFLIAVALVWVFILGPKILLEALAVIKWIQEERLSYFRSHWVGFIGQSLMRTIIIGFLPIMTLTIFQFSVKNTVGPVAVAAVVFFLMLMGLIAVVGYGCRSRIRNGKFSITKDRAMFYRTKIFLVPVWESNLKEHEVEIKSVFSMPFYRIRHTYHDHPEAHMDHDFIKKFGWMSARYRRTRWWFLAYYLGYLFIRAAFLGGGRASPLAQIYGLLVLDIVNFFVMTILNPFESARNTAMGLYILNICRISTTGISIAFLPGFAVDRIITTALGIIIMVIHVFVVIALLILITLGALSARLSLLRNREEFSPHWLDKIRIRWFERMDERARDSWKPPRSHVKKLKEEELALPPQPYFSVATIRRSPKIEDEDEDNQTICDNDDSSSSSSSVVNDLESAQVKRCGRTVSIKSARRVSAGSLPRTGRQSRIFWSSREFGDPLLDRPGSQLAKRLSGINFDTCSIVTSNTSMTTKAGLIKPQSSLQTMRTARSSLTAVGSMIGSIEMRSGGGGGSGTNTPLPSPGFIVDESWMSSKEGALVEATEPPEDDDGRGEKMKKQEGE